jgi:hypothetical protein
MSLRKSPSGDVDTVALYGVVGMADDVVAVPKIFVSMPPRLNKSSSASEVVEE